MAGPLGEMFDHGCDAMNTTVSPIPVLIDFLTDRTLNALGTFDCSWRSSSLAMRSTSEDPGGPLPPRLPLSPTFTCA